jgi:hypothetical protein
MHKLSISLLLFSLTACGQQTADKIKYNVQNTKTTKHINIPGTRLFIIPPAGFTVSKTVTGLQKGEQSMINVMDLVGGNFYSNAANFSKAKFEQKGIQVFDYQEIKVNGFPAKYILMQGDPNAKVYSLVFGDSSFSTMIMAIYSPTDEATGKQLIAALNTIHYDKSKKIDPFEMAIFSLDDKNSTFKFFQYSANMYMYTPGGIDNTNSSETPFLVVTQLPGEAGVTAKMVADKMSDKMEQYGFSNTEVKNISESTINGYEAYQAEIYGDIQGKRSVFYQCVVVDGDKIVSMQGMAKNDLETNVKAFRELTGTVRIK